MLKIFKSMMFVTLSAVFWFMPVTADGVQAYAQCKSAADQILTDAVTYVKFSNMTEAVPVSYVKNGEQLLAGDGKTPVYAHRLVDTIGKDAPLVKDLVRQEEADETVYGKGKQPDVSCVVTTSGDWELFTDQLDYQVYSMQNQPSNGAWNRYFKKLLKKQSVDSPVVIKESYTFAWEGVKTDIVTASNVVLSGEADVKKASGEEKKRTMPSNQHAAVYTISALFRDGKAVCPIFSDIQPVSGGMTAFDRSGDGIAFYPPSEKGTMYQDDVLSVQFGEKNQWKKFRCFFNMNGEGTMRQYRYFPKYLVCDLDGDGCSELVAYHDGAGSLWQVLIVYRLVDGMPERSFVITP